MGAIPRQEELEILSNSAHRRRRQVTRRPKLSTSTVLPSGELVPWLAAEGPLAYTPEDPPDRDFFFQYSWVLPGIFADETNTRQHYYFGGWYRDTARELFRFWENAREGTVDRVTYCRGSVTDDAVTTPVAIYRTVVCVDKPGYLLIQHGSYQFVESAYQPMLEGGDLLLYRGVQRAKTFRLIRVGLENLNAHKRKLWK